MGESFDINEVNKVEEAEESNLSIEDVVDRGDNLPVSDKIDVTDMSKEFDEQLEKAATIVNSIMAKLASHSDQEAVGTVVKNLEKQRNSDDFNEEDHPLVGLVLDNMKKKS